MLVRDLSAEIEKFRTELEEHAQIWRDSLDHTLPDYPIRNGGILRKQSEGLARKLGRLRPYIDKFGFPSFLTMLGQQWDIYDSAVGMDTAVRKGHSIEKSLQLLQQILGRLDGMDANSEVEINISSSEMQSGECSGRMRQRDSMLRNNQRSTCELLRSARKPAPDAVSGQEPQSAWKAPLGAGGRHRGRAAGGNLGRK